MLWALRGRLCRVRQVVVGCLWEWEEGMWVVGVSGAGVWFCEGWLWIGGWICWAWFWSGRGSSGKMGGCSWFECGAGGARPGFENGRPGCCNDVI